MGRITDVALAGALAVGLCLIAFLTTGGTAGPLGANTWTEIVLLLIGAGLVIWLLAAGRPGPAWGAPAVALFGALAALTALSIAWSVAPDLSWIDAGQTLAYFASFGGGAILARLLPARWPAAAGGIAVAATVIAGWAVLAKALTLPTDMQPQYGRLLTPFDYWNATGLIAAIGLPPAVWAASRREGPRFVSALAVPAIALLVSVVVLSYSRSALLAAVIGLAMPLGLGRVRLRSVLMLAVGGAGAAVICGWALGDGSVTGNGPAWGGTVRHAARVSAGHAFGLVVVLVLVAVGIAVYVVRDRADRTTLTEERRRQIGTALVSLLGLIPIGAVVALFASSRGFTGEISHMWSTLISTKASVGSSASRLLNVANSRPAYWHQGWSVGVHHPLAGAGAASFGVAHLRYSTNALIRPVPQAHSYVIETFADFGLIGVAVNVALLCVWGNAVKRTLASWVTPERDGLVALLGVAVAFGFSSAIDWTWFVPGVAVPALVAAGWLAGRGPLGQTVGLRERGGRRSLVSRPGAIGGVTVLVAVCLGLAYAIWQPLRSADADGAAVSAAGAGRTGEALGDARAAVAYFPVSLQAISELASLEEGAGLQRAARAEFVHGTSVQPDNPFSWSALGQYELRRHHYPPAVADVVRAQTLDYQDPLLGAIMHDISTHAR